MSNSNWLASSFKGSLSKLAAMRNISTTVKVYLLLISSFTFFRIILFATNLDKIPDANGAVNWTNVLRAFLMGLRFDIVVCGYLLLLFYIVLTVVDIGRIKSIIISRILFIYVSLVTFLALILSAADIPYFKQFYSRISINALQWIESPGFIIKMIVEEPRYYLIILPLIFVLAVNFLVLRKIFNRFNSNNAYKARLSTHIVASIIFLLLMFLGIRGRVEIKSPIRVGTAYFCNNSFLNQAGLNPVFTFMTSYLDKLNPQNEFLALMDDTAAIKNVRKFLNIKDENFNSPIARVVKPSEMSSEKLNVVIVIMEAMSAAKMGRYGNPDNLTPYLDSLAQQGWCFDNIYTAGIHTYNGVFGILFSYPALASQHPMKAANMLKYNGIASTLKQFGYQTMYFTTHDGQFDNAEGFLYHNDFTRVYTKSDYPEEKILSTLGVPDDYLFEFVSSRLDELSNEHTPFLAAILTASDHGPYIIPEYFHPKPNELTKQIVEYADWSIGKFILNAKQKQWFDSTIFVFIADHGAAISPTYEMPLNYHHSPLIFYAPVILDAPKTFNQIGGQIDVFPTIMGLLKLPYINNTFGIDLLKESRPYIYFSADDKYGVLNDSLFLIVNNYGKVNCYKYRLNDVNNYFDQYHDEANEMKLYAESNMQTAQYMIKNNKQYVK